MTATTTTTGTLPATGTYTLDTSHAHVGFKVRHLMVSKVRGGFSDVAATLTIAEEPTDSAVEVSVGVASIDTKDEQRDAHLRGADFFDVERFQTMTFRSTAIRHLGKDRWEIVGDSQAMRTVMNKIERVAPVPRPVLVLGPRGTGKELVARAIHVGSERGERKFVVTNCSAFNDNLLDSELFGHKRGAFTGAVADKPGLFEVADAGTFFLDEIGDMSPSLQVKVLRVLQEGTFNRVGDTEMRKVDVRIIAATNRDLTGMVAAGRFREDLYYRIHVLSVTLPALRDRREDVPLLIDHFLARHRRQRPKRLTPECAARMLGYPWPGNVRELENEIERLVVLAGESATIGAELLSPRIRTWAPSTEDTHASEPNSLPAAVEALERRMIGAAMQRHGGNKTRAAEELKVSRRNLIRLVQKYELE